MKQAIIVKYVKNNNIAFAIEGFENKKVDLNSIKDKVLNFYERLHGLNNVKVEQVLNDFVVTTERNSFLVSWSWVSSYQQN